MNISEGEWFFSSPRKIVPGVRPNTCFVGYDDDEKEREEKIGVNCLRNLPYYICLSDYAPESNPRVIKLVL